MNTWLLSSLLSGSIIDPVAVFLTILAIMLVAPLLFERLQLPGIVGLILAGVVVGPYGIGLLERGSNIILLGTVGLWIAANTECTLAWLQGWVKPIGCLKKPAN